jgi:hypothetical protein
VRQQRYRSDAHGQLHHDVRHHHSHRAAPWFVVAAVALLAAIISGCGGEPGRAAAPDPPQASNVALTRTDLFDSDFVPACDGVGIDRAAPFSQTPGVIHPVLVLAGQGAEMYVRSGAVREAWTRAWTPDDPLALAEVELVVCAERKSAVKVQECTGYEVDGEPTDAVVNLNEVVYDVSLHAARTGVEVAATTITARDDACPMFVSFAEGAASVDHDSFDPAAIERFVERYVAP